MRYSEFMKVMYDSVNRERIGDEQLGLYGYIRHKMPFRNLIKATAYSPTCYSLALPLHGAWIEFAFLRLCIREDGRLFDLSFRRKDEPGITVEETLKKIRTFDLKHNMQSVKCSIAQKERELSSLRERELRYTKELGKFRATV